MKSCTGYADDRITGFEEVWNQFQAQIEPIAATKAYMVCPGVSVCVQAGRPYTVHPVFV